MAESYITNQQFEILNNSGGIQGSTAVKLSPSQRPEARPRIDQSRLKIAAGFAGAALVLWWLIRRVNPALGPGYRPVQYGEPWMPADPPVELHYTFAPVDQTSEYPPQPSG
jgi:hypothetical protein